MFHTMCWLSGYGWGKLGEVKLPYNPVISALSETWRREKRTMTQRPLGKVSLQTLPVWEWFAFTDLRVNELCCPARLTFREPKRILEVKIEKDPGLFSLGLLSKELHHLS